MKRELCRDVVGNTVRLLRNIWNKAGDHFPAGTLMRCDHTYRGRYTLVSFDPPTPEQRARGYQCVAVSQVRRDAFVIEDLKGRR